MSLLKMLCDLSLFLRNNVYDYRSGIDDNVADMLLVAISNIERLLKAPDMCNSISEYSENNKMPSEIFEKALELVKCLGNSSKENQDTDTLLLFWAYVLIDSALFQALEHAVLVSNKNKLPLVLSRVHVLNSLDRAIVIGGATQKRLCWIHRMIDFIEGPAPQMIPSSIVTIDCESVSVNIKHPIARYSADKVDLYEFQKMIQDSAVSRPFIIENAIDQWPALSSRSWANLEYLRVAVGHDRLVPVELGTKYTDCDWTQDLMPFGQFIDEIVYPSAEDTERPGYLAQHDLCSQAHRLCRDFWVPDYALVDTGRYASARNGESEVQTNIWFGPKGTVSPLHFDGSDNLFAQVAGCKYFRFYSPEESECIYAYPKESLLKNTSQVDVACPDINRFPLFEQAQYSECVVRPGDLLYIPPRWWHYVKSLTISASISFWF